MRQYPFLFKFVLYAKNIMYFIMQYADINIFLEKTIDFWLDLV